jgi:cold shock CspA family protein
METGIVKWYNYEREFGFITPDDGGDDLLVRDCPSIKEGRRVSFRTIQGDQGMEAVDVRPL